MTAERTLPGASAASSSASALAARAARVDRSELLFVLGTALVPLVALVPVLRLWRMDLTVPFEYGADATFNLMLAQNLLDGGWVNVNPGLGAPFGQELYDFPLGGDTLNLLALKLLGLIAGNAAAALNLFYLLTYPAVALSAVLVLRRLGLSRPASFVAAVLFAMLPYHFWRGETHLFLAAYVAVPVGCYLALRTFEGRVLFARRADGGAATRWFSRTTLATLGLCALVASTGLYYAFFTVVLLLAASVIGALAARRRAVLISGLAAIGVIGIVIALELAPSAVYRLAHGPNEASLERGAQESELFGLRLTQLLLPVDGHRLAPLARRSSLYDHTTVTPVNEREAGQTLGTIGDLGFLALVVVAVWSCVGAAARRPPPLLGNVSAATLVAVLFGITTGFATLFAYAVTPKFHAPGRISVFVAFLSLLAAAVVLDALLRRIGDGTGRRLLVGLAAAALVAVGIADQTTNAFVPSWTSVQATWDDEGRFVDSVERALPAGAPVFQLPYTAFPESQAPGRMLDYDHARPYLHADGLRWSYGAMKGRARDWPAALAATDPGVAASAAAAAGFAAILLDRNGDDGTVDRSLRRLLGSPTLTGVDGRYELFDLRRLIDSLGPERLRDARDAALHPARLEPAAGFVDEDDLGPLELRSTAPTVRFSIANPRAAHQAVFSTTLQSGDGGARQVDVTYPDGTSERVELADRPVTLRRVFRVPAGDSEVTASVTGPPGTEPSLSWDEASLVATMLLALAHEAS